MLTAHRLLGIAVVAVALAVVLFAIVARLRKREPGAMLAHLITLEQTLLVAQVGLGLLLLSDDRRSDDDLHYLYGTLALAAALSPWFYAPAEPRRRFVWFAVATVVAGALAVRAYMTAR